METFLIKAVQLIAAFGILILVHEFGHYIFARMFGIWVEKFYLFFDPWFKICSFNKGKTPVEGETRIVIPSPKVATYDLQPEMSAYLVTDKVLEELDKGEYDVVILNFANCDMVGHTGVMDAAVKAVHTVDECVKKVTDKILAMGGSAIVTADHGNADQMIADDGKTAFTQHTTFPVPVILVSEEYKNVTLRDGGVLADLAPTLLDIMKVPQPKEMTGKTLIK